MKLFAIIIPIAVIGTIYNIYNSNIPKFLKIDKQKDDIFTFVDSSTIIDMDNNTNSTNTWTNNQKDIFMMETLIKIQNLSHKYNNSYLVNLHLLWYHIGYDIINLLINKDINFEFAYSIYVQPLENNNDSEEEVTHLLSNAFLLFTKYHEKKKCIVNYCPWPSKLMFAIYDMINNDLKIKCNDPINKLALCPYIPSYFFNHNTHHKIIQYICQ